MLFSKRRPLRFIHIANIFKAEEEKTTVSTGQGTKEKMSELKVGPPVLRGQESSETLPRWAIVQARGAGWGA